MNQLIPAILLAAATLAAADDPSAALKSKTGVHHASSTGKTPSFVVDAAWPQPLPHNWLLGQIGGLYVDQHDHIWVYNRPRTMTTEEAGLEGPVPGFKDAKGEPVNGLGQARPYGPVADCCKGFGIRYGRQTAARVGRPNRPRFSGRQVQGRAGLHLAQQRARHLHRPKR